MECQSYAAYIPASDSPAYWIILDPIRYYLIHFQQNYPNGFVGAEFKLEEAWLPATAWELEVPNGFDGADWKGFELDEAEEEFWIVFDGVTVFDEPNGFDAGETVDGFQTGSATIELII